MKPAPSSLAVVASVLLCSCLNFDTRLAQCRDDAGGWMCPDAGVAGRDGGSATDGGDGPEGLVCNRGWCWDHPRPTGASLESVWGTSASDVWVGGQLGTLLHFDGTRWESYGQEGRFDFTSICGHAGTVYFGAGTTSGGGNRLFSWNGSLVSEVNNTAEDINQLACGSDSLWMARMSGVSRLDWGTTSAVPQFSVTGRETCAGVTEASPGVCIAACDAAGGSGTPFVRMHRCDGSLEYELVDTAGTRGTSFGVRALWTDPHRGVLAAIDGARGEIRQRDSAWGPAWSSSGSGNYDLYAGTPTPTGSIAVGAYGLVVTLDDAGVSDTVVSSSGNDYLLGVWSPPSGDVWVVGERGCILERDAGAWVPRSDCVVGFEDFATTPRFAAVTVDGLYHRTAAGWVWDRALETGQVALWENPDGGRFAHLSDHQLSYGDTVLPLALSKAALMQVVSEQQVIIATGDGLLITTNLVSGPPGSFDAGVNISRLALDPDGTVWAAGSNSTLLHSVAGGGWERDELSISGDLTDFAVGFGRQWALSGSTLATRHPGESWTSFSVSNFDRVVPVDAETALIINGTDRALRVNSTFGTTVISPPPDLLEGRIEVRGTEVWAVGSLGGLVRFPIPP